MKIKAISHICAMCALLLPGVVAAQDLPVLGYLERARVGDDALIIIAKLDTGADTSSLGYSKLTRIRKNGVPWVRFTVLDEAKQPHRFELPVAGKSTIRRRRGLPSIDRPIVNIRICVGNVSAITPVNLADRANFSTQLLIGRSFLHRRALVDSARALKAPLECGKGTPK